MKRKVTKAIFPVAGLGTRFLPATKSIPKEIMTLVDRPLIQYAIDEAREAGIKEFIFVTAKGKGALEDYFDAAPELEKTLRKKGKLDLLQELRATDMDSGAIAYIRQREALGLGHAVWCARRLISNEPFAVILPDDVIASKQPCLQQMTEQYAKTGGNIVAAMEVSQKDVPSYGILNPVEDMGKLISVKDMAEKPDADNAPSNLAVIGRYILEPNILRRLNALKKGAGDEIQLTDAIAAEARENGNVFGYRFEGQRYDCGSKIGYLKATIAFGLARDDLKEELGEFIDHTISLRQAAE
ncbi:MAG: UTP--glucose-1-phosphate uridylyltransferase GalU [Paracoccaceae bacterium]